VIPGADAPDQLTPHTDHSFLNRDEGNRHRLIAVVLQVSGFSGAETHCSNSPALCQRYRRKGRA
jgi:hypothetical protein